MLRASFNPWRRFERSEATFFFYHGAFLHSIFVVGLCGHLAYIAIPPSPLAIREPYEVYLGAISKIVLKEFSPHLANSTEFDLRIKAPMDWRGVFESLGIPGISEILADPIYEYVGRAIAIYAYREMESAPYWYSMSQYALRVVRVLLLLMLDDFMLMAVYNNRSGHLNFLSLAHLLHYSIALTMVFVSVMASICHQNLRILPSYLVVAVYSYFMSNNFLNAANITRSNTSKLEVDSQSQGATQNGPSGTDKMRKMCPKCARKTKKGPEDVNANRIWLKRPLTAPEPRSPEWQRMVSCECYKEFLRDLKLQSRA